MVGVWRSWYVLYDGHGTRYTTAAERIVWRSPYNEQDDEKGGR